MTGGVRESNKADWTEPFSTLRDMWQEDESPSWPQVEEIIEQLCRRAYPDRSHIRLSDLIARYGDDKVQFQNLDHCADKLNMNGVVTKITFGTEQRLNLEGTEKLGLVVWLDRERVKEITAQFRSAGHD